MRDFGRFVVMMVVVSLSVCGGPFGIAQAAEDGAGVVDIKSPEGGWTNSVGMWFKWVPPGTYLRGSPEGEPGRDRNNETQHEVTISRGFWLGTFPVTQAEWVEVMGSNPSRYQGVTGDEDRPVESISWDDAQQFIAKLNEREGTTRYRLPTEAEWEYACRAGSTTALYTGDLPEPPFGDDRELSPELDRVAWYSRNSFSTHPQSEILHTLPSHLANRHVSTQVVGQKAPNAWGFYDMLGNVQEWCEDLFRPAYPTRPVTDPVVRRGDGLRVRRGGAFIHGWKDARSAARSSGYATQRAHWVGLRIVSE